MSKLEVYTLTSRACPQCNLTKMRLQKKGIPYVEIPVEDRVEEFKAQGLLSAPVVRLVDEEGTVQESWAGFRPDKLDMAGAALAGASS